MNINIYQHVCIMYKQLNKQKYLNLKFEKNKKQTNNLQKKKKNFKQK